MDLVREHDSKEEELKKCIESDRVDEVSQSHARSRRETQQEYDYWIPLNSTSDENASASQRAISESNRR